MVLKYCGQLSLVLAVLTLVPLAMSIALGDAPAALRHGVVVGALALAGAALARRPAPATMQANEGLVIVAAMFLIAPLAMSYPLMSGGMAFADALFEAVSAVTTTGLSTGPGADGTPPALLFARAWMQWYGGLGFVVLSLALVMRPGLLAKGLAAGEVQGAGDLVGGTRAHARRVLAVYLWLTAAGLAGTLLTGVDPLGAVLYVFAAVSTGGFAPGGASLAALGWPARAWILALCLAGAIPLTLYYRVFRQRQFLEVDMLQLAGVVAAAVASTLLLAACLRFVDGLPWGQVGEHAPLLAISAQTTAGFSSLDPQRLDPDSKLVLIFSMLVGGGAGSTAGGLKVLRLMIVAAALWLIVRRAGAPREALVEPHLGSRRLQADEIQEAMMFVLLFVVLVAASTVPFVALGYPPLDALFEVASAVGTVGLSAGLTSAALPLGLKAVLGADMLLGRLEILAWLVVLYPRTWIGRRSMEP